MDALLLHADRERLPRRPPPGRRPRGKALTELVVASRRGWPETGRGRTWPNSAPTQQLDHILRNDPAGAVQPRGARVAAAPVSDHRLGGENIDLQRSDDVRQRITLVDLLLDVAVTGINKVEREGVSVEHPASFVLIGSGNPEEGELRPQLLDRFGLHAEVKTENYLQNRIDIVERRERYDRDRDAFCDDFEDDQEQLRKRISRARAR